MTRTRRTGPFDHDQQQNICIIPKKIDQSGQGMYLTV
jgi:hypothetical protein